MEHRTVRGDRERVECIIGRSAFESELGFELAGVGSRRSVEFGGKEEEEGGDGEGFHCRCFDIWLGEMAILLYEKEGC